MKLKLPEILNIEPTNFCNAKCTFCPREKMKRKKGVMDFKLFRKIIDEAAKNKDYIKEVNLSGYGEPLLDKEIIKKIEYIKSKFDPIISITTNASLLDAETAKRIIESGLDEMRISFYSINPKTYKRLQKLDYKKTWDNLVRFSELKKKLGKRLPRVIVSFLCLKENELEKEKWKRKMEKLEYDVLPEIKLHNYLYGRDYNKVKANNFRLTCLRPQTTMQILWNGKVCLCCVDLNGEIIFGNLKNKSLHEVFNSKEYRAVCRKHLLMQFDKLPLCNICDQLTPLTPITLAKRAYYSLIKRPIERRRRKRKFLGN